MKYLFMLERFDPITNKYMPDRGEGTNIASQTVKALNRLVALFYVNGDVYDNRYRLRGGCDYVDSCANWLYAHADAETRNILDRISTARTEDDYEEILWALANHLYDEGYLKAVENLPAEGTIYKCKGPYKFIKSLWPPVNSDT